MDVENLKGAELRFDADPRDLDGEERYLVTCIDSLLRRFEKDAERHAGRLEAINSLHRQFEKDTEPYRDRLVAIRSHSTFVPFYVMLPNADPL